MSVVLNANGVSGNALSTDAVPCEDTAGERSAYDDVARERRGVARGSVCVCASTGRVGGVVCVRAGDGRMDGDAVWKLFRDSASGDAPSEEDDGVVSRK